MQDFAGNIADWIRQPFRSDMNVGGWFAFLGLIIGILALWGWFLSRVRE